MTDDAPDDGAQGPAQTVDRERRSLVRGVGDLSEDGVHDGDVSREECISRYLICQRE